MDIIEDGKGSGKKAEVDSNNRLRVNSTQHKEVHYASRYEGGAYDFSTGAYVTISSTDTETGLLYLKNTSTTQDLIITSIRTCAEAAHKVKLYKNPTGGTLISAADAGTSTNVNFKSANEASALIYKGAEGRTLTGGSVMTQHIMVAGHSNLEFNDALILGPGNSLAITIELGVAGDACGRIVGYYKDVL